MQKVKNIIAVVTLLFLLTSVVAANYYYNRYKFEKREKDRLRENQEQYLIENSKYILLKQSLEEFKTTMPALIDSALKAIKIKPKNVERIIERHYFYRDTSLQSHSPDPVITDNDTIYPFSDTTKCIIINGFMQLQPKGPVVTITNRLVNNNSIDIAYIEREQKFLWWRVGKWKGKLKTINQCGETITKEVEIVK